MEFLTLDIEEWYHANYDGMGEPATASAATHLESNVDRLIDLCDRANVKSTCFVLGEVAERKPRVVQKLAAAGHEIASHGFAHRSVNSMTPAEFRSDIISTNSLLEEITGQPVLGYRAPSFSVDETCITWFYDILAEAGLKYSSSVFPGKTFLYGISGFPPAIHFPRVRGDPVSVLEVPVNAIRFFNRDFGLYFRLFSASFIGRYIRRNAVRGTHTVLYLHPREIDPDQPRLDLPMLPSLVHYWGVRGCERKVERVLARADGEFIRMSEIEALQH